MYATLKYSCEHLAFPTEACMASYFEPFSHKTRSSIKESTEEKSMLKNLCI